MIIQSLRKAFRVLTGKELYIRTTQRTNKVWYGSAYGGFFVCPDELGKDCVVYSFGIGHDITFDLEIIEKHGCAVYGFDPTPKSIEWLSQQKLSSHFHFFPYGIAAESGLTDFYLPVNKEHVSGSLLKNTAVRDDQKITVMMKAFTEITADLGHKKIELLKMDIEGAEYEVLPAILDSNVSIRQIVVEFHHRIVKSGPEKTKLMVALLKEKGYEVFGVSDRSDEISFIKSP